MSARSLPIIMSAESVRSILAGRKTATRRILKPQPEPLSPEHMCEWRMTKGKAIYNFTEAQMRRFAVELVPYAPGDELWVREAWRIPSMDDFHSGSEVAGHCAEAGYEKPWAAIQYEADGTRVNWRSEYGEPGRLRSPIHMPRWASRLTLTVREVRVQRLQEISEEDAIAEGIRFDPGRDPLAVGPCACWWASAIDDRRGWSSAVAAFKELWESLHGPDAWSKNPWVCVVGFVAPPRNIDAPEGA